GALRPAAGHGVPDHRRSARLHRARSGDRQAVRARFEGAQGDPAAHRRARGDGAGAATPGGRVDDDAGSRGSARRGGHAAGGNRRWARSALTCRCWPSWVWRSPTSSPDRYSENEARMFGDLSFSHILILLLVLVLVFGAKRIPEIGKSIGQGIKEFNRSLKDATSDQPPAPPRNLQPPGTSS